MWRFQRQSSVELKAGHDLHVQTKACKHGPDELLEKDWGRFITVLEKVGIGQLVQKTQQHHQQRRGSLTEEWYKTERDLTQTYAGSTDMVDTVNLETVASMEAMMSQQVRKCWRWQTNSECV